MTCCRAECIGNVQVDNNEKKRRGSKTSHIVPKFSFWRRKWSWTTFSIVHLYIEGQVAPRHGLTFRKQLFNIWYIFDNVNRAVFQLDSFGKHLVSISTILCGQKFQIKFPNHKFLLFWKLWFLIVVKLICVHYSVHLFRTMNFSQNSFDIRNSKEPTSEGL